MTRFLFVSLPLVGHLDWGGMLATAAVLAQNPNNQVAWASGPQVAATVDRAGVEFLSLPISGWSPLLPLPPDLPVDQRAALRRTRALDSWLDPATIVPAVAGLQTLFASWQPDAVVLEPYAAAGAFAGEAAGLPMIVCGRPALPESGTPTLTAASQRLSELCAELGLAGTYWDLQHSLIRSPLLHIDYFSSHWYTDLPAVAPQTHFAGCQRMPQSEPLDPPTVLITLGSLFRDDPAFFRIASEAVMVEGAQPWVVTGRPTGDSAAQTATHGLPAGTKTSGWVDFDAVMPQVTGIIHHGGVGTTHAALRHGLPQVVVPRAGDQQPQAGRVTQAGVGYGVRPVDFTPATARWLARQLLSNELLHDRAAAWREELQSLGGAPTAARAMEQASNRGQLVV